MTADEERIVVDLRQLWSKAVDLYIEKANSGDQVRANLLSALAARYERRDHLKGTGNE